MCRLATCFVLFTIIAITKATNPRSVNIALETILAFDKNDKSANIRLIDDVQKFLTKVREVVEKEKPVRRSNNNVNSIQFTDFVTKVIDILNSYEDNDLEDVFAIIDDEIRKYHYKGCKFYELVTNNHMRRYVASTLDLIKDKPAKDIRKNLNATLQALQDAKFDTHRTQILDYINSLYTKADAVDFGNILDNLQTYKSKSKRANMDLVKVLRHGIRSVIFDHYSKLTVNTRRDLKFKLETFWQYVNRPDKLDNNVWNLKYNEGNNSETTPLMKDDIDNVVFLNELLEPYKQGENKQYNEKENNQVETIVNENEVTDENTYSDDHESDKNIASVDNNEDKDDRDQDSLNSPHEWRVSEKEESKGKEGTQMVTEKGGYYKQYEREPISSDEESSTDISEEGSYNNNIDDSEKVATSLFMYLSSKEVMEPKTVEKSLTVYESKERKAKKNNILRNKIKSPFVTLYPEAITSDTLKTIFKIEATTKNSANRLHTLWKEEITGGNKRKNRSKNKGVTDLVAPDISAQVNIEVTKTPVGFELQIGSHAKDTKTKSSHKRKDKKTKAKKVFNKAKENKDTDLKIQTEKEGLNTYLKSGYKTLQDSDELKFILKSKKITGTKTGFRQKSIRSKRKQTIKSTAAKFQTTEKEPPKRTQTILPISKKKQLLTTPKREKVGDKSAEESAEGTDAKRSEKSIEGTLTALKRHNNTWKLKEDEMDIEQLGAKSQGYQSEEGLSIESYEDKNSLRKSNDFADTFNKNVSVVLNQTKVNKTIVAGNGSKQNIFQPTGVEYVMTKPHYVPLNYWGGSTRNINHTTTLSPASFHALNETTAVTNNNYVISTSTQNNSTNNNTTGQTNSTDNATAILKTIAIDNVPSFKNYPEAAVKTMLEVPKEFSGEPNFRVNKLISKATKEPNTSSENKIEFAHYVDERANKILLGSNSEDIISKLPSILYNEANTRKISDSGFVSSSTEGYFPGLKTTISLDVVNYMANLAAKAGDDPIKENLVQAKIQSDLAMIRNAVTENVPKDGDDLLGQRKDSLVEARVKSDMAILGMFGDAVTDKVPKDGDDHSKEISQIKEKLVEASIKSDIPKSDTFSEAVKSTTKGAIWKITLMPPTKTGYAIDSII